MILQALHELAEYEGLLPDPDFELRPIPYWIELNMNGEFLGFSRTREVPASEQGKKKPREIPKSFLMPREPGRQAGAYAYFLYDKADYIFGKEAKPEEGKARSAEDLLHRAKLFRGKVQACLQATSEPAIAAVLAYLEAADSGSIPVAIPEECGPSDLFSFRVRDEIVVHLPKVRKYWKDLRQQAAGAVAAKRCLVTGQVSVPVRNHVLLKQVPGATAAGAPLVSFNSKAFESYGWSGNENAPISREAAESYGTALQRLVHPAPPDPAEPSRTLARLNLRLSSDTLVAYWSPGSPFAGQFGDLLEVNSVPESPQEVRQLYESIWRGKPYRTGDPTAFYALVLSGAQGRVITRGFIESTVGIVDHNLARHFGDLDVVRNTPKPKKGDLRPNFGLRDLLSALGGLGQSDEVPPALAEQLIQAALRGTPYPTQALQRALLRHRAEIGRTEWTDLARRDARAALIKAVLERRRRFDPNASYPEVQKMLDPENRQIGYLCGRLMALTERLQQVALKDVNASVVDRFFGAASATPQSVFPRLLKNARHHARKASDGEMAGFVIHLEREIDRVAANIDGERGFPSRLSLEQQGLFVIGYHHQRHALFQPRDKDAAVSVPAPASAN